MTARSEGGDTEPAPRQHTNSNVLVRRPMNCRHLGRVTTSPDPGTSRGRRPEAPDGVAPVGAKLLAGKLKTWVGWDSVGHPAAGTRNIHPLTATFPTLNRALGGSAVSSQLLAIHGKLTTVGFYFSEQNLTRAVKATRPGPLVASGGGS